MFAAVFVVFGVFWALKNTGIAMTGDPTCGFAEHTHNDACYTQTLACGQEEIQAHQHSVANGCYAATQQQAAGDATSATAQAASDQTLTCTTPETPGHTHAQACYQKTLTCTMPEHTHTESCYGDANSSTETPEQWEATLPTNLSGTWTKDVVAVAQSQLDYTESQKNITTNDKGQQKGYTRYGAWAGSPYADWSVPFATFCLHYAGANDYPVALTCAEWTQALQNPEYGLYHPVESGYEPKPGDAVFFAKAEDAEKVATARTKAAENLTKAQAEAAATQGVETAAQDAQNAEIVAQDQVASAYVEVAALADHVGIVEGLLPADQHNPDRIRVIQGDAEDAISHTHKALRIDYERSADRADARILGYAEVPENAEALQKIMDARQAAGEPQAQSDNQITQTFEGEGYTVKATYSPEAQLPEGAELRAIEYARDSEHYQQRYAEVAAQYGWEAEPADGIRLFDVGFYVGDTEVEPAAPVTVTISCAGQQQDITYEIVHFGDELETVQAETTNNNNGQDISFTLDSFSELFAVPQVLNAGGAAGMNGRAGSAGGPELTSWHKTIDAFRDNNDASSDNPDTNLDNDTTEEQKKDLYRLYLDATLTTEEQGIDLVIVVDESSSMSDTDMGDRKRRDDAVEEILNDTGSDKGLINGFLGMSEKNRVAVVGFFGDADTTGYQTDVEPLSKNKDNTDGGWVSGTCYPVNVQAKEIRWTGTPGFSRPTGNHYTNYIAGLKKAEDLFKQPTNNSKKVLIFISDGVPTIYYPTGDVENGEKEGGGYGYTNPGVTEPSKDKTKEYFNKVFWPNNNTVDVYTVGIFTGRGLALPGEDATLKNMADVSGGRYLPATNKDELEKDLQKAAMGSYATNLKIEDNLSEYVDYYKGQPDLKVVMKDAEGHETLLYGRDENGNIGITTAGQDKLESVAYYPNTRKVVAQFKQDYEVESGCTYTLSFNVVATKKAYEDYALDRTYGSVTGDAETDYSGNETSSNKPGFHSNNKATVSFTSGGTEQTPVPYEHPVIQAEGDKLVTPDAPTTNTDGTLTWNKTIDAFRDGVENTDTILDNATDTQGKPIDKTDLYRLNLTAELASQVEPLDLLIVVDQSGSMHMDYDTDEDLYKDMQDDRVTPPTAIFRDEAVRLILDGTYGDDYEAKKTEGLIYQFLKANKDNYLAVVGFQGKSPGLMDSYNYNEDATVLVPWTKTPKASNVAGQANNGTNYSAGLLEAKSLLTDPKIAGNGHKKVMLFLSDGIPTYYLSSYTGLTGRVHWNKGGLGYEVNGIQGVVKTATESYFEELMDANPNLIVNTVSVASNANTGDNTILENMKRNGGNFYLANNTIQLRRDLKKLMYGAVYSDLTITDTLSDYVDLASTPDFKVTLHKADGTEVVLYKNPEVITDENGNVTEIKQPDNGFKPENVYQGQGILHSVTYDKDTKKITATFEPDYIPEPGTKVTLSFNVKTTGKAYRDYVAAEGNYLDGGASGSPVEGDKNTDYDTAHVTSSGQPGFHSNKTATLTYKKNDETQTVTYPNPVVQAVSCDFVLKKTSDKASDNVSADGLAGAEFKLYRKALEGETGKAVNGLPAGMYVKVDEGVTASAADGGIEGQIAFENLVPTDVLGEKYYLVETKAPLGHAPLTEPITLELTHGTENGVIVGNKQVVPGTSETYTDAAGKPQQVGTLAAEKATITGANGASKEVPIVKVVNKAGFELPETGGGGVGTLLGVDAMLMACAGVGIAAKRRRKLRV
ncbi:DUF7604 domain-containing protein [Adlercreutzia sp. ZJ141]|uniref:DUF7604 domain-containing protein n=1 Tax=Adlercreutzia sp. ZJ141 TaxID=2709406 RepID=UPI0013ED5197|nr:SpaA isopeptide-forming pilin-related protein [Adlercreutzia sp. ZJ141]